MIMWHCCATNGVICHLLSMELCANPTLLCCVYRSLAKKGPVSNIRPPPIIASISCKGLKLGVRGGSLVAIENNRCPNKYSCSRICTCLFMEDKQLNAKRGRKLAVCAAAARKYVRK